MKKCFILINIFFSIIFSITTHAADLIEVYRQALCSDATFQQTIAQQLSNKQGVPISLAALLPAIQGTVNPTIQRNRVSGITFINPLGNNTQRNYVYTLSLTQTVFNFAQFANLSQNISLSKQADAMLNSALQDLMMRVVKAYFAILQDEDTVRYNAANREAYKEQLDQVTQQFNVGLKTITDVYTARASYDSSTAQYIAAVNTLADDKENLRVITGVYYPSIAKLSEKFPLVTPCPANIDAWADKARQQNWSVRAAQFAADAACANVKQQFAGHLPSLQLQGGYNINFNNIISSESTPFFPLNGTTRTTTLSGGLLLNVPIVQGGLVSANTQKAKYDYQVAFAKLDLQMRNSMNTARQSYLGILSGISQVEADRQNIKSSTSSLEGMREGYKVGTQTLVDVLITQQKVFQAYQQYAIDRYAFVNNLVSLKLAAGTLSQIDLEDINYWLINGETESERELYEIKQIPHCVKQHSRRCPCSAKNSHSSSEKKLERKVRTAHQSHSNKIRLAQAHKHKNHVLVSNRYFLNNSSGVSV